VTLFIFFYDIIPDGLWSIKGLSDDLHFIRSANLAVNTGKRAGFWRNIIYAETAA